MIITNISDADPAGLFIVFEDLAFAAVADRLEPDIDTSSTTIIVRPDSDILDQCGAFLSALSAVTVHRQIIIGIMRSKSVSLCLTIMGDNALSIWNVMVSLAGACLSSSIMKCGLNPTSSISSPCSHLS